MDLSVSSYVEAKDNREVVDIGELNAELKITVAKINQLRSLPVITTPVNSPRPSSFTSNCRTSYPKLITSVL